MRSRYLALASSSHAFDRRLSKLESKPAILVRARSSAPIVEASVRTSATLPDPRFHQHIGISGAAPPPGTVVLPRPDGSELWLALQPHGTQSSVVEVLPYHVNGAGTLVHCFNDGRDYLVDSYADWIGQADKIGC